MKQPSVITYFFVTLSICSQAIAQTYRPVSTGDEDKSVAVQIYLLHLPHLFHCIMPSF